MEEQASHINVYLSTTAHTMASNLNLEEIKGVSCPVCSADIVLGMFGWGRDLEGAENHYANVMKDMAKTVFVDSEKKYLFIGENPKDEEGGLIIYQETNDNNKFASEFFKRWDEIHMLMLEFTVFDMKSKPRFVLRGLWSRNEWHQLKIEVGQNIHIVQPNKSEG